MSSVIIKGMNLPENCHTCKFAYPTLGSIIHCKFHIYPVEKFSKRRHFNCPFSAGVPTPHGDLIDKEQLKQLLLDLWRSGCNYTISDLIREIVDIKPIIEAEE